MFSIVKMMILEWKTQNFIDHQNVYILALRNIILF